MTPIDQATELLKFDEYRKKGMLELYTQAAYRYAPAIAAALIEKQAALAELQTAVNALLTHWDENGREQVREFEGEQYLSPAARMIQTPFIVALRRARQGAE